LARIESQRAMMHRAGTWVVMGIEWHDVIAMQYPGRASISSV
jgi:hypothetical protein